VPSTNQVGSRRDVPEQPHNDMDLHDRQMDGVRVFARAPERWMIVSRLITSILPKRVREPYEDPELVVWRIW
jgi:hypothetical protein